MTERTSAHNLKVATSLYNFIEQQVLPAVGVKSDKFWKGFSDIVTDLAPKTSPCWPSATASRPKWTSGTPPTQAPWLKAKP